MYKPFYRTHGHVSCDDWPVCKNRLILPPVCPQLRNSAPEILKGQF